jgi:oxygen-independent coproporphyrinogen-3 oxidase
MRLDPSCRLFLEANPEDADAARLASWKRLGVETLSLGIQSFDAEALQFLGRRHGPERAREALEQARRTGFATVAIDLIYGLPQQSLADWERQLDTALRIGVDHLSCYQLTIHEKTRFGLLVKRDRLKPLAQDAQAEFFRGTHRWLAERGMPGYEASQFAAGPEHQSRHNWKYWTHTPYLGLGPSAHSFEANRRWWNLRRTDDYQRCLREGVRPVDGEERLDARALTLEALMTGLRTYAGVDLERVRRRWGIDLLARNRGLLERLAALDLLRLEGPRLVPTLDGLAVADSLATQFELG